MSSAPVTLEDLAVTIVCLACRAPAGRSCTTRAGKPARYPHGRRFEAVEDAAGITQHRTATGHKAPSGFDRAAEEALLASYAARPDIVSKLVLAGGAA